MAHNKNKICINNGSGEIKYILSEQLSEYLQNGWIRGNGIDQKSVGKQWYNNGFENVIILKNQPVPPGFIKGMCKHPGTFSKYRYRWYTNGVEDKRILEGSIIPTGWIPGQSITHKEKNKIGNIAALKISNKPYSDEYKQLYNDEQASVAFFKAHNQEFTVNDIAIKFNCTVNSIWPWLVKYELYPYLKKVYLAESKAETDVYDFIKSIYSANVIQHDRKILDGKELDIYIPDKNLAIEFNGTHWHSTNYVLDKHYHEKKSRLCESKGIRLIHIYEDEWNDPTRKAIILSILRLSLGNIQQKIFARKCQIKLISNKEAQYFNEKNHLQSHRNAQITYGLFYNDNLMQLMSFSKHKKYEWEIIRGCPGSNNIVIGGVSKLFKHFIKEHQPKNIFSYCDFNKFDGNSYTAIGMKFIGYTGPNKFYSIKGKLVERNPYKRDLYESIADEILWGAGSKKYLWEDNNNVK